MAPVLLQGILFKLFGALEGRYSQMGLPFLDRFSSSFLLFFTPTSTREGKCMLYNVELLSLKMMKCQEFVFLDYISCYRKIVPSQISHLMCSIIEEIFFIIYNN